MTSAGMDGSELVIVFLRLELSVRQNKDYYNELSLIVTLLHMW